MAVLAVCMRRAGAAAALAGVGFALGGCELISGIDDLRVDSDATFPDGAAQTSDGAEEPTLLESGEVQQDTAIEPAEPAVAEASFDASTCFPPPDGAHVGAWTHCYKG